MRLMGVVNVTPDSFSDGGLYLDAEAAIAHGEELAAGGAAILDVGGESTRPGAERGRGGGGARADRAGCADRVRRAGGHDVSIDTSKAAVAEAALDAGAAIVNDVTALRGDPGDGGALRRARRRPGADAHARRPADDAGRPRLRRRRRRGQGLPRRAARGGARRRDRRGADLARPRDRLRQDRRAQPRAAAPARRAARARPAAGDRHLAQELHRRDRRLRGGRAPRRHDRLLGPRRRRGRRGAAGPRRRRGRARRSGSPTAILG